MAGKRKGRQEPTVWSTLPYRKSLYKEAVEDYEATGQKVLVRDRRKQPNTDKLK